MLERPWSILRGGFALAIALSLVVLGAGQANALEGEKDPSFPTTVTTDVSGASAADQAKALAVQANGRIVVAGSTTGLGLDTAIVRYTAAGALDSSFDSDGEQVVPVGAGDDQANGVAIGPDGKIVVAGYVSGTTFDTTVLSFNPNGSPDSTFAGGTVVTDALPNLDDQGNAVAVQADGKVVVVGTAGSGNDADFEILRYRTNGTLDPAFDDDGIVILDIGDSTDKANAVVIQPDGKIVVAGSSFDLASSIDRPTIVRLLSTGAPDPNFGASGIRRDELNGGFLYGVTLGEGGRIVAAGFTTFTASGTPTDFVLTSTYAADGSSIQHEVSFSESRATGVALQPDGKMLVSTVGSVNGVARLMPNGAVDPTFGNGGSAASLSMSGGASGVAVVSGGKIVVSGTTTSGSSADFSVARLIGDETPPWGARMIGVPRYSLVNSRTVSWTASDIGTGVAAFDVQSRSASFDGSPFSAFSAFRTNTPNAFGTFTGSPGKTYCLRVRGRDFAGNVGVFGEQSCEAIPLDERSMTATGSWTKLSSSSYYRETAMSSKTAGSKLSVHASYRHLAVVVTTCSACGTLKVFRGTTLLATVDLSSPTTKHRQVIGVDSSRVGHSGTITLRQSSAGKQVVVEGLAVSRA
jgi:uncharacterized delta-60 repeat protein